LIKDINLLVIGDVILDEYVIGNVERISPEGAVPIVNVIDNKFSLGGCGNVVNNIVKMGANGCARKVVQSYDTSTVLKDDFNEIVNSYLDF